MGISGCKSVVDNFARKHGPTVEDLREIGVTKAMRVLDATRKHNATEDEVHELGVCGRLDIQVRQLRILLWNGYARFYY